MCSLKLIFVSNFNCYLGSSGVLFPFFKLEIGELIVLIFLKFCETFFYLKINRNLLRIFHNKQKYEMSAIRRHIGCEVVTSLSQINF